MSQNTIEIFEELKNTIISNYANFMNKKHWTQKIAAEEIKCSRSHLSKILSGKRNPSNTLLKAMEEVMNNERK